MTQRVGWGIAAVAVVVAGCAGPAPEPGPGPTAAPTTAAPATSAGERALPVYYVAQTAAGPRLQREFHRLAAADPGSAAVREMLAHPTGLDPDYRNPWPPGTGLRVPVASTADAITVDVDVRYVGFDIPSAFVVGYGLDYGEHYRTLPFVGTLTPEAIARGPRT